MEYSFKSDDLKSKTFSVKQFESMVTTLKFSHPNKVGGINITTLSPMLLVSTGDVVPLGDELSYSAGDSGYMTASWCINGRYTQKNGSFFVQLAFADANNTIKLYSEKLMMIVEPSIDYQRDFLEYNPLFMEKFKEEILSEVEEKIPTKVSELENDSDFATRGGDLANLASKEYVDSVKQEVQPKENRRQIIRFSAPANASKVIENVEFTFDSTGKYLETVFISLDSNGEGFSLKDFTLYLRRTVVATVYTHMKVYANAANIDSTGTLLLNFSNYMSAQNAVFGSVTAKRIDERWKTEGVMQSQDNGEPNIKLYSGQTVKLKDETLTSLKLVFDPVTVPTANILVGTVFELWGTDA